MSCERALDPFDSGGSQGRTWGDRQTPPERRNSPSKSMSLSPRCGFALVFGDAIWEKAGSEICLVGTSEEAECYGGIS